METLPFRSPSYFLQTEKTLEKLHTELKEIKNLLDSQYDQMQNLELYQKVHFVVTYLLEQISNFPRFMALIEEELNKFIKEDKEQDSL